MEFLPLEYSVQPVQFEELQRGSRVAVNGARQILQMLI